MPLASVSTPPCAPFARSSTRSPAAALAAGAADVLLLDDPAAVLEVPVPVVADEFVPVLDVLAPAFADVLVPVFDVFVPAPALDVLAPALLDDVLVPVLDVLTPVFAGQGGL